MPNTLKLTHTLADETRYSIYQYVLQEGKEVTVHEIATAFSIHPNVARMHLTKLADVSLLTSELLKSGKGGRPARIYKLAETPIHLSFPRQESQLLLQWLLDMVNSLGTEAIEKGKEISYQSGWNQIYKNSLSTATFEEKMSLLTLSASSIGYIPEIKEDMQKKIITFSIYNCPYKEYMNKYPELICSLHESFLQGQFDALFKDNEFVQVESMQNNHCNNCLYQIEVL